MMTQHENDLFVNALKHSDFVRKDERTIHNRERAIKNGAFRYGRGLSD